MLDFLEDRRPAAETADIKDELKREVERLLKQLRTSTLQVLGSGERPRPSSGLAKIDRYARPWRRGARQRFVDGT
ncbi:hypothetical protein [Mesorhizobium sp. M0488]|uniref:hypothetical protein n=1 Tax=unclassified Mesorhizobium TaxID=325217 RepID=UPI00333DA29F